MSLNDETSWVLKWGTVVGLAIMAVGLVLSFAGFSEEELTALSGYLSRILDNLKRIEETKPFQTLQEQFKP